MKKTLLAVVISLMMVIGCGGGGSSSSDSGWTGPVTPASYPDVQGKYTLTTTTRLSAVCTDGSTGTQNGIDMTAGIKQVNSALTFYDLTPTGDIIYEDDQMHGTLTTSGDFVSTRNMTVTISGAPGKNTINYKLTGAFTETGWHGIYEMKVYNDYIKGGCTYTAPFTGTQFNSELP